MHLCLLLCATGIACWVRLVQQRSSPVGLNRWQHTLGLFLFSPLLLLVTTVAVLDMGQAGQMLGLPVGEIGFSCALSFLSVAVGCLLWRLGQTWRSLHKIRQHPTVDLQAPALQNRTAYLLDTDLPFAAQVGFWHSNLVVSRGLLAHLSAQHVMAVLTHEQAHAYYRDTFWFFWLGWLRQITAWLPNTERLWQELLLLREMRADQWASSQVDALLVAEALLQMTQLPLMDLENSCAAIGSSLAHTRLEERIEALLAAAQPTPPTADNFGDTPVQVPWFWLLFTLMPLSTVVLHH